MNPSKLALKYIKHNKLHTFFAILGTTLAVLLSSGLLIYYTTVQKENEESMNRLKTTYDFVETQENQKDFYAHFSEKDIAKAQLVTDYGTVKVNDFTYINIAGYDRYDVDPIQLIDGHTPTQPDEIVISASYQQQYNVQIDETITLAIGDRMSNGQIINHLDQQQQETFVLQQPKMTYKICGVYQSNERYGNYEIDTFIVQGEDAISKRPYKRYIELSNEAKVKLNALIQAKQEPNGTLISNTEETQPQDNMIYVFVLSIIFVLIDVYFLLKNVYALTFKDRLKQYGLLKSAGATNTQIKQMIIWESCITTCVSIVIGMLASIQVVKALISNLMDHMGDNYEATHEMSIFIDWKLELPLLILILIIALFSSYSSSKLLTKMTTVDMIKGDYTKFKKAKKIKKSHSFIKHSSEYFLAKKYRNQNRYKYYSVIIASSLSILLYLCGNYMIQNMNLLNHKHSPENMIYVQLSKITNQEEGQKIVDVVNEIRNIDGVASSLLYHKIGMQDVSVKNPSIWSKALLETIGTFKGTNEHPLYLNIYGIPDEEFKQLQTDKTAEAYLLNTLDYESLDHQSMELPMLDHEVTLALEHKEVEYIQDQRVEHTFPISFQVTPLALEDFWQSMTFHLTFKEPFRLLELDIILPESTYYAFINQIERPTAIRVGYSNLELRVDDNEKVMRQLYDLRLKNSDIITSIYNAGTNDNAISFLETALNGAALFLAFISLASVANIVLSNMLTRKAEYAVLTSIGMERKQLFKMLFFENVQVFVTSLYISILISIPLNYFISQLLKMPSYQYPFLSLLQIIFVILVLGTLLTIVSMGMVKSNSIVESMKEEQY